MDKVYCDNCNWIGERDEVLRIRCGFAFDDAVDVLILRFVMSPLFTLLFVFVLLFVLVEADVLALLLL